MEVLSAGHAFCLAVKGSFNSYMRAVMATASQNGTFSSAGWGDQQHPIIQNPLYTHFIPRYRARETL